MKLKQSGWRKIAMGAAAVGLGLAALAHATNYTLWVNGRTGGGQLGNYADFTYWGPAGTAAGVNKKAVNWDGYNRISTTNGGIRDALEEGDEDAARERLDDALAHGRLSGRGLRRVRAVALTLDDLAGGDGELDEGVVAHPVDAGCEVHAPHAVAVRIGEGARGQAGAAADAEPAIGDEVDALLAQRRHLRRHRQFRRERHRHRDRRRCVFGICHQLFHFRRGGCRQVQHRCRDRRGDFRRRAELRSAC